MEILVVAALIGLIPAAIASNKGYNFALWWFFGAGLFIVALPVALLMAPNVAGVEQSKLREGMKKCPFCAEFVKAEAKVCKHCGRDFLQAVSGTPTTGFDDGLARLRNEKPVPPKFDEWGRPLEQPKVQQGALAAFLNRE